MNGAPLLWLIPALPLAAVLLNLLLGDRLGRRGAGWLACGAVGLSFAWSVLSVLRLAALPEAQRARSRTSPTPGCASATSRWTCRSCSTRSRR